MITPKTQSQKIMKIGSSFALILDKTFVHEAGFQPAQEVSVTYIQRESSYVIALQTAEQKLAPIKPMGMSDKGSEHYSTTNDVSDKSKAWTKDFLKKHKKVMDTLANL